MRSLLGTHRGRLATFFFLYVTEGIPHGFTSIAIAAQMRRQGVGPAAIGVFIGSLYLPWSWKWAVGPVVDVVSSDRLGRRRAWIVGCQLMMIATLLAMTPFDFMTQMAMVSWIVLVHNVFAATQDVAIDALACDTLEERERGLANGLMFAGHYLGSALGGSGVLFLAPHVGFDQTYFFVAGAVLMVVLLVALRLKEPRRSGFNPLTNAPPLRRISGGRSGRIFIPPFVPSLARVPRLLDFCSRSCPLVHTH